MGFAVGRKLWAYKLDANGLPARVMISCPACGNAHFIPLDNEYRDERGNVQNWTWNGSGDKPTFSPSLNVSPNDDRHRCHSFIQDGRIQYLSDCGHAFAGQTIDLPDWPDDEEW